MLRIHELDLRVVNDVIHLKTQINTRTLKENTLCLYVADPATFLATKQSSGDLILSLRTACLYTVNIILSPHLYCKD